MKKEDIRNWIETETEKSRTVDYDSYHNGKMRAHITVHIPKRTPEEQEAYEKRVKAALREFYHAVTKQGLDWDEIVSRHQD